MFPEFRIKKIITAQVVLLGVVPILAMAQQAIPTPRFEVASVKPVEGGAGRGVTGVAYVGSLANGGMIRYASISLGQLLMKAYDLQKYQIQGPSWLSTSRYEIVAKAPAGVFEEQFPQMLQQLLVDRFRLSSHFESRAGTVLHMEAAKGGPKLKPNAGEPKTLGFTIGKGGGGIALTGYSMDAFAELLTQSLGRPVDNATGIAGTFDMRLGMSMQALNALDTAGDDDSSLPNALAELGLHLRAAPGQVKYFVIDSVDKVPVEN
jgi:uncharacterized protein (TIGR03435 family)